MSETNHVPSEITAALRAIVQGTAAIRGEHFFQSLVQYLAISLGVKASFAGEITSDRLLVRTLAAWVGDCFVDNFTFPLEGSPCKGVLSGEIQHYPDSIQETFPNNPLLKDLQARSYLAIPLQDQQGNVQGHLAVIDNKPLPADERELAIFHIFAARATAELIRRQTALQLDEIRERESRLRAERRRMEAEVAYLRDELRARSEFSEIVGESDAIWKVLRNIDLVANTDSTVLIQGETGTGKELVARAIHRNSKRSSGPFVRVNCASLPESLLESELFGHELGAFTGATQQRTGRFELADGGTILLDEIGEMSLAAQSRLLRVLQEQELERVGSSRTIRIDTRVLAATNRSLLEMVDEHAFREDLFYRLNVFPIHMPPLRERLEDIPTLVRYLLKKLAGRLGKAIDHVPDAVFAILKQYSWPGNVRELENIIERAMILTQGDTLQLASDVVPHARRRRDTRVNQLLTLNEVERQHIEFVLAHTHGVVAGPHGAAAILELNPNTLRSRMEKLGIKADRPDGH